LTPVGWSWARVPYASSAAGATEYGGTDIAGPGGPGDGVGVIEPDKVGELGYALVRFYELTGETRYRDAAIVCADALAAHVSAGDDTHSPWPFRVFAESGAVVEDYTAHVIGPLHLLDELIRLGVGDTARYRTARDLAFRWLLAYPMKTNLWSKYFEDVAMQPPASNVNQYAAGETARYLLDHPELDPDWQVDVRGILAWIETTFAHPQDGANAIAEQTVWYHVTGSHTARYAAVNALLYAATGDTDARDKARRAFDWASYMCLPTGVVVTSPEPDEGGLCFSVGDRDDLRHFATGLGAVPEWSPPGEDHLVRSSSVVMSVSYTPGEVRWQTFDAASTEVLRLGFTPGEVTANGHPLARRADLRAEGWVFDDATAVMRVRHDAATVLIVAQGQGGMGCGCRAGGGGSGWPCVFVLLGLLRVAGRRAAGARARRSASAAKPASSGLSLPTPNVAAGLTDVAEGAGSAVTWPLRVNVAEASASAELW